MVSHFKTEHKVQFGGYVPPNVVAFADKFRYNKMAWRTPEMVMDIHFANKAGMPDGKYVVPGLVWSFGDSLDLWAYKDWKGNDTELYRAPFFNVNNENVCLGTASDYIKQNKSYTFAGLMETVETAFFRSKFTHVGSDKQINGAFAALLEKTTVTKKETPKFPYEYLVESGYKLSTVIEKEYQ